ncbi:MAG: hypothetical protein AAF436_12775 [Myxococcota bacterium]
MNAPAIRGEPSPLSVVQAKIDACEHGRLTLDPSREEATPLPHLIALIVEPSDPSRADLLAEAAVVVAQAQLENFPDNLFWDFDLFLATIDAHARLADDYETCLRSAAETTVNLMCLYGQHSKIRFRYVHDFIYGFDWARWVRRAPALRRDSEPFGLPFLIQSEDRGRDILRLIDQDDPRYPSLTTKAARNPFPFVREPADELSLYQDLAAHDLIPVPAWCRDATSVWDRDFDALRKERAVALGLARHEQGDRP